VDTTQTITHVSLCAGYGGIDLGLHRAIPNLRTIAVSEIEAFACANLVAKMEAGLLDPHLSGRILKPSHGPSFVTAWTSSLAATRASHSAQPASDSEPKTHDTSGRLYQPELLQCDQVSVSLKTSRDISALGYPTCCKTWQDWVTERRGAWRARVNAARLTRGSGSSSWPTVNGERFLSRAIATEGIREPRPRGQKCLDHLWPAEQVPVRLWDDGAWTTPTPWQQEESLDSWETRKAKNKAKGYNGNGQGTPLGQDPWPSRPGEQQFAWEPPRVVGGLANSAGAGSGSEGGDAVHQGWSSSDAWATSVSQDSERQVGAAIADDQSAGRDGAELGNAASQREGRNENAEWQPSEGWDSAGDAGEAMGRPNSPRPQERPRQRAAGIQGADADGGEAAERQTQPPLGRDADGPADWLDDAELYTTCDNRTDELRLLGNGVVPAVAERAFRLLFGELTAHNTTQ
jgi:hypothetical protein